MPKPKLTGPIKGGAKGFAFCSPDFDLAKYGYVVEEFFIESDASAFDLVQGTEQTQDGKWRIERRPNPAAFKTRILVVRPQDNARFNGTVMVHWQNVTAGYELGTATEGEYMRGYAWVGVSAQKIGIDGFEGPNPAGLKIWDRERYGSLLHPGDDYSFDIFTQAARLVAPKRKPTAVDPMGGLKVKRLIAAGGSQSAGRLRAYINGVHPIEPVFDAFLNYIDWSTRIPFRQPPAQVATGGVLGFAGIMARPRTRIRDDLHVPVFVINSESEVRSHYASRQPDTAKYRFWETAGTSHGSVPLELIDNPNGEQRPGTRIGDLDHPNWISYRPVFDAAFHHLHVWLVDGKAPPIAPLVTVKDGPDPVVVRDADGNALGGIRLPDIAVPTAEHRGEGQSKPGGASRGYLSGYANMFTPEKLHALYPSAAIYMSAWDKAMARDVAAGYVLALDVSTLRAPAERWSKRLG
jgi:hypothetical protein